MSKAHRLANQAFTLVELLMVVTVIVLLLTFLLPAMMSTVRNAEYVQCASNLYQIGRAEINYTTEYGTFSTRRFDLPNNNYTSPVSDLKACLIYPFAPNPELYLCKTFVSVSNYTTPVTRSYVANWNKGGGSNDNDSENVKTLTAIRNLASFGMFTEENPYTTAYSGFTINDSQLCAEDWPGRDTLATYHLPNANRYQVGYPWGYLPSTQEDVLFKTGIANVSMADGHVEGCNTLQTEHKLKNTKSINYPLNPL